MSSLILGCSEGLVVGTVKYNSFSTVSCSKMDLRKLYIQSPPCGTIITEAFVLPSRTVPRSTGRAQEGHSHPQASVASWRDPVGPPFLGRQDHMLQCPASLRELHCHERKTPKGKGHGSRCQCAQTGDQRQSERRCHGAQHRYCTNNVLNCTVQVQYNTVLSLEPSVAGLGSVTSVQ